MFLEKEVERMDAVTGVAGQKGLVSHPVSVSSSHGPMWHEGGLEGLELGVALFRVWGYPWTWVPPLTVGSL